MKNWNDFFEQEKQKPYFNKIVAFLDEEKKNGEIVYPPSEHILSAFNYTPFGNVKVVILGQDPYHGPNQAHGLAFSVNKGIRVPPSLANMYKELEKDIPGFKIPNHGYLESWANQGVMMLNNVLTVRKGLPASHANIGWEIFTDAAVEYLNKNKEGLVFLLWGSHAHKKGQNIDAKKHYVLKAAHPSPFSAYRGFFGCNHFSKTNEILKKEGKQEINWSIE